MDISGIFQNVRNTATNSTNKTTATNKISSGTKLPSNQVIKGEVVDVTNKDIKIKVGDQVISGNLNLEGKLNIGDVRSFFIEMEAGKLRMTVIPESEETLKDTHIENVLKELGELSKENLKLAKSLLDSNLPVNKESLATLKRSMALFGMKDDSALEKSLLMMKNELPVNSKNTENLNSVLDREHNITKNLQNIDTLLAQLGDDEGQNQLATQIKNVFTDIIDDLVQDSNINQNVSQEVNGETVDLNGPKDLLKLLSENLGDEAQVNQEQGKNDLVKGEQLQGEQGKEVGTTKEALTNNGETSSKVNGNTTNPNPTNQTPEEAENSAKFKMLNDALNNGESTSSKEDLTSLLLNKLGKQSDGAVKVDSAMNNILEHLANSESENLEEAIKEDITKSFEIGKNIKNPKELEGHINDKLEKLEKALELIKNSPKESEVLKQLEKEITTIKEKLTFANEIKNNTYVQIPFTLNNKTTNGELIVFKERKNKKGNKGYASALISLDTANLGVFEAYVVKKSSNVDIQFRFVEDFVKGLVQGNIGKLNNLLNEKSFNISAITYKKIDEPFSIIDDEPIFDENINQEDHNPFKLDIRG